MVPKHKCMISWLQLPQNNILYHRKRGLPKSGPFFMLKYKALFYRYTGIYLAEKEENAYMRSKAGLRDINQWARALENQENARSIALGTWQCDNGFTRPISRLRYVDNNKIINFFAEVHESLLAMKYDLRKLLWRYRIRL